MINRQTINTRSRGRVRDGEEESIEGSSRGEMPEDSSEGEGEREGQKRFRRDSLPEETRRKGTTMDHDPAQMVKLLTESLLEVVKADRQPIESLEQLKSLEEKTCCCSAPQTIPRTDNSD